MKDSTSAEICSNIASNSQLNRLHNPSTRQGSAINSQMNRRLKFDCPCNALLFNDNRQPKPLNASQSSHIVRMLRLKSCFSNASATVDLPAPE
jgi:hypothetical protein